MKQFFFEMESSANWSKLIVSVMLYEIEQKKKVCYYNPTVNKLLPDISTSR